MRSVAALGSMRALRELPNRADHPLRAPGSIHSHSARRCVLV